jgi:hypothetical protein
MPEPVEQQAARPHETRLVCQNCRTPQPFSNVNCITCGISLHAPEWALPRQPATTVVYTSGPAAPVKTDADQQGLLLNLPWLCLLMAVSGGVYLYYWIFLTWKQLQSETGERHHAIGHALSLAVPVYGLFRFHKHLSVIRDLVPFIVIMPGWGIVMYLIADGLESAAYQIFDPVVSLALWGIGACLLAGLMIIYQGSLNQHWRATYDRPTEKVSIGVVEALLVIAGFLLWTGPFLASLILS